MSDFTELALKKKLFAAPVILAGAAWLLAATPFARHAQGDPAIPARVPAVFPAGWRFPAGRQATFAQHAIVASNNRLAAEVGAQVMKLGGNDVDSAADTGFTIAVVYPEAGNLGGGGCRGEP